MRLSLLTALLPFAYGLGQKQIINFGQSDSGDSFQLAGKDVGKGQILVSSDDYWGVIRAAGDLAVDFGRVTGTNFTLSNGKKDASPALFHFQPVNVRNNTHYSTTGNETLKGPAYSEPDAKNTVIIAGTLGHSAIIDKLVADGHVDASKIKGEWEAFVTQTVKDPIPGCSEALVIVGSMPRGTIYGIYDISEQIGVSPWHFWADVPSKSHPSILVSRDAKTQPAPTVKFRGIFLNDEQPGLTNWISNNWPDSWNGSPGYNHHFYALVAELLLRLRANYLWPAIWGSILYTDDPMNQPLLHAYEIVLGSSHTEPLMRAQNEFGTYYQGKWAYDVNNKTIDEYFEYGVQRAKPYARNSLWTMSMRGSGDTPITGLGTDAIIKMLETLIHNQREIMSEGLGVNDITTVPQSWCLYQEVQSYFEEGLKVPDDITLLWSDDNWGNLRRLPVGNETERSGGAGVYYHFDFVGGPRAWKWINAVQLSKTTEQMQLAYARKADRIWIVNVGDLKPLEIPINHFLDMAYDAKRWGPDSTEEWTKLWAAREFGDSFSQDISSITSRYGKLAARRRWELLDSSTYSVINYNEADTILDDWRDLEKSAQKIHDELPKEAQPAFFQLLLHPTRGGRIVHEIYTTAALNNFYALGKRNSANDAIDHARSLLDADADLTLEWNDLLDGKWANMLDQTHLGSDYWQQPMRNALPPLVYVQTKLSSIAGNVRLSIEGSNATVPGDDKFHTLSSSTVSLPPLDRYSKSKTRWFDVFSAGTYEECDWKAAASEYLDLDIKEGTVGVGKNDTRVRVSVDWDAIPDDTPDLIATINVTSPCRKTDKGKYSFRSPVLELPVYTRRIDDGFKNGFVESDGYVAIEAPHYQAVVDNAKTNATYHNFSDYGRTVGGVGLWPRSIDSLSVDEAPYLEYDLYLFTNDTVANVTVFISSTLNYLGDAFPLEYAISLTPAKDKVPTKPKVVRPVGPIKSVTPPQWESAVADSVWGGRANTTTSSFQVDDPGHYTLRLWLLFPGIIAQKIVVDLGGLRESYLGPPESYFVK